MFLGIIDCRLGIIANFAIKSITIKTMMTQTEILELLKSTESYRVEGALSLPAIWINPVMPLVCQLYDRSPFLATNKKCRTMPDIPIFVITAL